MISMIALLVLRVTILGLRYAHVSRATRDAAKSLKRAQCWKISRGKAKGRQPFFLALPSHLAPNWPAFCRLHSMLLDVMGEDVANTVLMPDLVFRTPSDLTSAILQPEPTPCARCQDVLRLLLFSPSRFSGA